MERVYCFAALLLLSFPAIADITCVFKYNRETRQIERECQGLDTLPLKPAQEKLLREGRASSCVVELKSDRPEPGKLPGWGTMNEYCR